MEIKSYKDLIVWQKAIMLVKEIFKLTDNFPKSEIFGLTSQMRRSAISIPSNIAEGYGRKSVNERLQFHKIAYGSGLELETQLIITKELGFVDNDLYIQIENLLKEVLKMLNVITSRNKKLISRS